MLVVYRTLLLTPPLSIVQRLNQNLRDLRFHHLGRQQPLGDGTISRWLIETMLNSAGVHSPALHVDRRKSSDETLSQDAVPLRPEVNPK
jgi:hypothetical protein